MATNKASVERDKRKARECPTTLAGGRGGGAEAGGASGGAGI